MTFIFQVLIILHIVGGSFGLLTGMINLTRKKGDKNHKLIGKVFYVSMLVTGTSALLLSCIHPNYFLFIVGVFTLYMVVSGQRYLKQVQRNNMGPDRAGKIISILMLFTGLLFISVGILAILKSNSFGVVYITFGGLGLFFVRQDFRSHGNKESVRNDWLIRHLQRMTGGFIAAMTAFLVVNAGYFPQQVPAFVYWLFPTLVFTPLIIRWSRRYEVKNKG